MDTSRTSSFTDLSGLNQLKQLGKKDDAAAIHKVAQQFESMFVSQLLKNMREGNKIFNEDNPLNSSEVEFHQEMYDQQLSLSLSSNGKGIGLADILERQLGQQYHIGKSANHSDDKSLDKPFAINRNEHSSGMPLNKAPVLKPLQKPDQDKTFTVKTNSPLSKATEIPTTMPTKSVETAPTADKSSLFDTPEQFIKALYQHAKEAATKLGVKTEVLLSQAALETGWGKHVMQGNDGKSSYNLFGIKAGGSKDWVGDVVKVASLEQEGGVMKPVVSPFRRYDSFKDSFDDYVSFLQNNPRYQQALSVAHDSVAFAKALQDSGYATDPDYASKLLGVMSSSVFRQ